MEFYNLFKRRTCYLSMLENVDRAFRKEKWEEYDRRCAEAFERIMRPFRMVRKMMPEGYFN